MLTAQYQIKKESRENSCEGRIEKIEKREQTWLRVELAIAETALSVSKSQCLTLSDPQSLTLSVSQTLTFSSLQSPLLFYTFRFAVCLIAFLFIKIMGELNGQAKWKIMGGLNGRANK